MISIDDIQAMIKSSRVKPQKSVLKEMAEAKAKTPITALPPLAKIVSVELADSITDTELLAVLAALISARNSTQIKHDMLCHVKHIKQAINFMLYLKVPVAFVAKGIEKLLTNLLDYPFAINCPVEVCDFSQVLTYDDIYSLAQPSGRAFAQAAAILIGAEANATFDLTKYTNEIGITRQFDNLVTFASPLVQCTNADKFYTELRNFCDAHNFNIEVLARTDYNINQYDINQTYDDMLEQVVNSQLVVGPPSFYTYAASCLDVPAIEVFSSREDINIFSKWSAFRYAAVLEEEIEHFRASRLEKAWRHWSGIDVNSQQILLKGDG